METIFPMKKNITRKVFNISEIIRFGYTACNYWTGKVYFEQKKKKEHGYFLSVEDQSTIDKKWKKKLKNKSFKKYAFISY